MAEKGHNRPKWRNRKGGARRFTALGLTAMTVDEREARLPVPPTQIRLYDAVTAGTRRQE